MGSIRPPFAYRGSKWTLARHYPAPTCARLIEPFAGGAGYALNYPDRDVLLIDSDPDVAGAWDFLIRAPAADVLALSDDPGVVPHTPEAAALVRLVEARQTGGRPGSWGAAHKARLVALQPRIRHWCIIHGDYSAAPDDQATWFIDPPYAAFEDARRIVANGRLYRQRPADYLELGRWCLARSGQLIVCEAEGADWLPFEPFRPVRRRNPARPFARITRGGVNRDNVAEDVLRMQREGFTVRATARILKVSNGTVSNIIARKPRASTKFVPTYSEVVYLAGG